ncbi:MAG: hypothetical protein R3330_11990 [Saprospiraceae bacterium]|nr:hypothetical protein [Saprospiraceae bacterium]
MKTHFFHTTLPIALAVLLLSACQIEDTVKPSAELPVHTLTEVNRPVGARSTGAVDRMTRDPQGGPLFGVFNILHLELLHDPVRRPGNRSGGVDLDHTGQTHAIDPMLPEELVIAGEGDAFTDDFGRGYTTLLLHYNVRTGEAHGTVYCDFSPIESHLEFEIEGTSQIRTTPLFDGPHSALILNTTLTNHSGAFSIASMDVDTYVLNASKLLNRKVDAFDTYVMVYGTAEVIE